MNKTLRYSLFLIFIISTINIANNFIFSLIGRTYEFTSINRLIMLLVAGLISGIITTILIITTAPVLKNYLTTFRQLLRLDTLSHPLLLKLQQNAPSTFQHSLQVASLAHRAAKAIGADAFLTRIGSYYHDIGKLKDPEFFIENRQENSIEPNLSPSEIVNRIHRHVQDGIKFATENNLPEDVIRFIPEHHGTLLASYLYDQAKEKGEKVTKKEFRYRGPKPMSRETAILMMADAIESKMRTLKELNKEIIYQLVGEVIDERSEDNQFDLSGLTKNDLVKLKNSFTEGAQILYHQRLSYPKK